MHRFVMILVLTSVACSREVPATAPALSATGTSAPAPAAVEALALRVVELENRIAKLEEQVKSHGGPAKPDPAMGGMGMHDQMGSAMGSGAGATPPMGGMSGRKEHGMGAMTGSAAGSGSASGMGGMSDM